MNFNGDETEKEPLQLQVTKLDKEAGITIENSGIYKDLDQVVKDNPDWGEANDFSVQMINTLNEGQETAHLML